MRAVVRRIDVVVVFVVVGVGVVTIGVGIVGTLQCAWRQGRSVGHLLPLCFLLCRD